MARLQIIAASTRAERSGLAIAQWFEKCAEQHGGFEVELVDLAEVNLPLMDEPKHPRLRQYTQPHTREWSARVDAADAFVFVTPEYNHGFPGVLKNAIDYLHHEWSYKVAGIVSYGGISAGTRSAEMLKTVLTTLRMVAVFETVAIPFAGQVMKDGAVQGTDAMEASARAMLDEMARWAAVLPALRRRE